MPFQGQNATLDTDTRGIPIVDLSGRSDDDGNSKKTAREAIAAVHVDRGQDSLGAVDGNPAPPSALSDTM